MSHTVKDDTPYRLTVGELKKRLEEFDDDREVWVMMGEDREGLLEAVLEVDRTRLVRTCTDGYIKSRVVLI